jgi:PAS domain S-box-containing protein
MTQVLIVEDHPAQLETINSILQEEGFETIPCQSPTEALDHVQSRTVGIAVVDLCLPGVTGTEFLDQLRAKNDRLHIIVYTGYGSFSSAKAALNSGAFAYLEKAGDPNELVTSVHRAMRIVRDAYTQQLEQTIAKQAQQEASFGRILDDSLNEIYIICANTLRILKTNRGALENLGYTMKELRQMTPLDFKPEVTLESLQDLLRPLQAGKSEKVIFEAVHQRKDGTRYPVEAHVQSSTFESQPVSVFRCASRACGDFCDQTTVFRFKEKDRKIWPNPVHP